MRIVLKLQSTHSSFSLGFGTNNSGNSIFGSKPAPGTLGTGLGTGFGTGKKVFIWILGLQLELLSLDHILINKRLKFPFLQTDLLKHFLPAVTFYQVLKC